MRVALILGMVVVLVGAGSGAAALTINEQQWEAQRLEDEAFAHATAQVEDARADALAERLRLVAAVSGASALAASLHGITGLASGWADSAALDGLSAALDALEVRLGTVRPVVVPAYDDEMLAEPDRWAALFAAAARDAERSADDIGELARAAREMLGDLARSVVHGGSSIADLALATEEARDRARAALATVADRMRGGDDPVHALADYSSAWSAVHDEQVAAEAAAAAAAAAEAAAAAAASASSGSGGGHVSLPDYRLSHPPGDPANPPILILDGNYSPTQCSGDGGTDFEALDNGEVVYVYSADLYSVFMFPMETGWFLRIDYC